MRDRTSRRIVALLVVFALTTGSSLPRHHVTAQKTGSLVEIAICSGLGEVTYLYLDLDTGEYVDPPASDRASGKHSKQSNQAPCHMSVVKFAEPMIMVSHAISEVRLAVVSSAGGSTGVDCLLYNRPFARAPPKC